MTAGVQGPPGRDGLLRRLAVWRARRRISPLWTLVVGAILALTLFPVAAILVIATGPSEGVWPHLLATVMPAATLRTLLLMAWVGIATLGMGTITAWLVVIYRFPGREIVAWLLLLPLAVPTYIVAYCYADLLDYTGPLQSALRSLLGFRNRQDYWFPEIRSLGGAVFVMSVVLYPYVYLSARASFLLQSVGTLEVARTLGRTPWGALRSVALPLARPALAAGVALALMECLNDIGATEYLGVRTLSVTAYATWLQRASLAGAAQIAAVMLFFVMALFALEQASRGGGRYADPTSRFRPAPGLELGGLKGWLTLAVCLVPFLLGFFLPMSTLLRRLLPGLIDELADPELWWAALHSLLLAVIAALLTAALAIMLAYARRVAPNGLTRRAGWLSGLGYALPGTVLALGLLIPLAAFDNWVDRLMRASLGVSTGLMLSGTMAALVLAYAIRFMAVSLGALEAGLARISPNLDAAARTLGESALTALRRVHFPLLKPTIGAALLLVFVDAMKELPATLLLRPFNFQTLSTRVYELAALERFEDATLAALVIVLVGLVPLVLLNRTIEARWHQP